MLWRVAVQSVKDMATDHGSHWAAAVAYYGIFSLFPLLLALSVAGSVFCQSAVGCRQGGRAAGRVPTARTAAGGGDGPRCFRRPRTGERLLHRGAAGRCRAFAVLTTALNIACDADETYSWFERLRTELAMLLTVGLGFVLALSSGFLLDLTASVLGLFPNGGISLMRVLKEVLPFLFVFGTLGLLYRFVPRNPPKWSATAVGALVAAVLFTLAQPLFGFYVSQFARYNLVYGSLSIVIVLLVWAWVGAIILLFGGEIASHFQMMVIEGRHESEVQERHEKRSPIKQKAPEPALRRG